jgi:hypothetical protein
MSRFAAVPVAALDDPRLEAMHIRVLTALCSYSDKDGWCRVGQDRIAERARTNVARVSQAISDLTGWGWVNRTRYGKQRANAYQVVMDREFDPEITPPDEAAESDLPLEQFAEGANHICRGSKSHLPTRQIHNNTVLNTVLNTQSSDPLSGCLKAMWDSGPPPSRERSSKKRLSEAVSKVLKARKDITAEQLLAAWQAFLRTPDARKDQGRFCPGIHVWLNDNRFDAFLPAAESAAKRDPAADHLLNLERCFYQYGAGGAWRGREFGCPVKPDDPQAAGLYPDDLYARYGVDRPRGAA